MTGLRDRKKQQTHEALSQAAIELFLKRGFDQVSVADIAAAADVSKPTLFKYFATKQDLALHRIADHAGEAARVVTAARAAAGGAGSGTGARSGAGSATGARAGVAVGARSAAGAGSATDARARVAVGARSEVGARAGSASSVDPVEVLRDHFVDGLKRRDPVTGLNDDPEVLAFHRLIFETPALATRRHQFVAADQAALAAVLTDQLGSVLAAELAAADLISTQHVLARRNWTVLNSGIAADTQYRTALAEAKQAYQRLLRR
ncbi:TetR family transcriptional regulator [Kribbella sp. CA-293567]|uniref:TetR family transcriptional regulator n=1 Tax=Kribbella sp. CA-293567 TaxID=3002436 RepID=UPI0022DE5C5B|nr:TetR family transcriptional regulator [Kribbella sp. CA-293567]WBQ08046.1 TetR family transcriptional regulator [Kribbella sp. CA-293567]